MAVGLWSVLVLAAFAWAPSAPDPASASATDPRAPADFLRHNYPEPRLAPLEPAPPETGGMLVRTRGCLECHRFGDQGARAGVDLYGVGRHLSPETIERLLLHPQEVNPDAIMPQPALTRAEALTIAKFLGRLR
jgi:hypothetical protein